MSNPAPQQPPAATVADEEPRKHILDQGPPDEEFWEKYSKHLEFPLSSVGSVLFHVMVGAIIIFMFHLANTSEDRGAVPMKLVEPGGFDDEGEGSAGSGGIQDPVTEGNHNPFQTKPQEVMPSEKLPDAIANIKDLMKALDEGDTPVSAQAAAAFSSVDEELRKKLLGSKRGSGPGDGRGDDGTMGKGPGGSGADSTRARTMRWVLRFRTASGDDYVQQLAAMGATIVMPVPPENKDIMYFPDLRNPTQGRITTAADTRVIANQVKFSDGRRDSVDNVVRVLKPGFTPKVFWAVFPKDIEEQLEREEKRYRNRRPEDIEETAFRISIVGGKPNIVVDEQKIKGR